MIGLHDAKVLVCIVLQENVHDIVEITYRLRYGLCSSGMA